MNREQEATRPSDATGLDPRSDPERWEHLVTRINEAAAPILAQRQPQTVTSILSAWRAPVAVGCSNRRCCSISRRTCSR